MTRPILIAPSVLAADFTKLGDECRAITDGGADRIHWDVMDGVFVPNLSFGPPVIGAHRAGLDIVFETHLMVVEPDNMLEQYVDAGSDVVIVHQEACRHLHRTLGQIRALGAKAGVSLNPATPIQTIEHVLDSLDHVLIMTVNPGFGGQSYLASMEPKVAEIRDMIDRRGLDIDIEVDGGISASTIEAATNAGANVFVAGSAVFKHPDGVDDAIAELRKLATAAA